MPVTGGLTIGENADHVRSRLAEDWYLEHNDDKHAVMLALRHADVDDLNYRARQLLHRNGQLGGCRGLRSVVVGLGGGGGSGWRVWLYGPSGFVPVVVGIGQVLSHRLRA